MQKIISVIYLFCLLSLSNSLFAQVTFTAVDEVYDCDATSFCVDISVSNFDSITSFQHVYQWDTSVMHLTAFNDFIVGLSTNSSFAVDPSPDSLAVGRAPYTWLSFSGTSGESFSDGTVIAEMCFDVNNAGAGTIIFTESNTTQRTASGFINGMNTGDIPAIYNSGTASAQDLSAPSISCPADVTVESFGTQVNGIAPTNVSDNCVIDVVNYEMTMGAMTVGSGMDDASGENFSSGVTTVTYTVTDLGGNTDNCSFTVTLTDPPATAGALQFIPRVNLDCDANTISIELLVVNFDSINGFQMGIQWDDTVLDFLNGNTTLPASSGISQSPSGDAVLFTFAPFDPANIPYSLPDSSVVLTLNYDLIGTLQTPLLDFVSFPGIAIGVGQQVNGMDINLTQDVGFFFLDEILNVIDNSPPTITNCPTDINQDSDPGSCTSTVTWTPPTVTDNCGLDAVTSNALPGDLFPVGDSTVTYTAVDLAGNSNTCSFVVTVADNENPVITCPANLDTDTDPGICTSSTNPGLATATDNCGVASVTSNFPGSLGLGMSTITYTATDVNGNIATCTQIVKVDDNENPTISCASDVVSCPGIPIILGSPTTSDNCGVASVSNDAPTSFSNGTTIVTYTVTDNSGNTASCMQSVTIEDTEDPMITCPADINECPGTTIALGTPTTSDNCGVASVTNDAPGTFPNGTTIVTYTVTDNGGNTATCTQTVALIDTEDPMITCPADINECPGTTIVLGTPTTSDNCGVASVTNDAPGTFPLGTTVVTHTATDVGGNTATCTQSVTVEDSNSPTITCPADIDVCPGTTIVLGTPVVNDNCGVGSVTDDAPSSFPLGTTIVTYTVTNSAGNTSTCTQSVKLEDTEDPTIICPVGFNVCPGTTIVLGTPTTSDNCGVASVTNNAPTTFPNGTTIITHTVTDNGGNTATCEQTVGLIDTENPMITCPADLNVCPGDPTPIGTPTTSDNCGVASVANDAPGTFPLGTTIVTHTATDVGGNTATCTQSVTVEDSNNPSISCPADIDVCPGTTIVLGTPTVNDNCGVGSVTDDAPASFPLGTTIVTYTVTNSAGNTNTCTQSVTLDDTEIPTITCPADMTVCPGTTIVLGLPTTGDNCSISVNNNAPSTYLLGINVVTHTVTDIAGNTNTCNQNITLEDSASPVITCPSTDAIDVAPGTCSAVYVNSLTPTVSDNCDTDLTITYVISGPTTASGNNDATGQTFNAGINTLTYTATDDAGNVSTCAVIVQVNDNENPVITCPSDTVINTTTSIVDTIVNNISATVSDNCGIASLTFVYSGQLTGNGVGDDASGTAFPPGTTTITYTTTDIAGNMVSCSFDVTIEETVSDLIDCPEEQEVDNDNGICGAVVNGIAPVLLVSPTSIASITYEFSGATTGTGNDDASGATFSVGTTSVKYIATDNNGNVDSCSFDVIVNDAEDPTWSNCPADITASVNNTTDCNATVTWSIPLPGDNCGVTNITASNDPGDAFPSGTTTVTYSTQDAAGNAAVCTFTVLVIDDTPPIPIGCPTDITVGADLPDCQAVATWTPPTFDDCPPISINNTHDPGAVFDFGTTAVFYIAIDVAGNDTTCTFNVTVVDDVDPVPTCPVNISVNSLVSECGAFVNWPAASATDNCDTNVDIAVVPTPGTFFPVGTNFVTATATDDAGNSATCTFEIVVNDVIAPTFDCPTQTVELNVDGTIISDPDGIIDSTQGNANCDMLIVDYNTPTPSDNCSIQTTTLNDGIASGDPFPVGTTTLEFITFDNSGNFATCLLDVQVTGLAPITVFAAPNDTICAGETLQLSTDVNAAGATFSWSGPNSFTSIQSTPTITSAPEAAGGIYSVTVTYISGCSVSSTINIVVQTAAEVTATSNAPVCTGADLELLVETPPGADIMSIMWTGPDSFSSDEQSPVIMNPTGAAQGIYSVVVTFTGGCTASASTNVTIGNLPTPEIDVDCRLELCLGENCVLTGTEYAPSPEFYNWSASPQSGAGLPFFTEDNKITITPTAAGIYVYTYSVELNGCVSEEATIAINVTGAPTAEPDSYDVIFETESVLPITTNDAFNSDLGVTFSLIQGANNGSVTFNPENMTYIYTPNSGFSGDDSFIYEICNNCDPLLCDNALVSINVEFDGDCEVPTLITPNDDGTNDNLVIKCIQTGDFPNNEIIIYNQWGDKVFNAAPYQNNWDGTRDGKDGEDLPDGTYFVVFKLDDQTEFIKQAITIFR